MHKRSLVRGRAHALVLALVGLLTLARTATTAEPQINVALKAATVVKFFKYTDWPNGRHATESELRLCVAQAPSLRDAFKTIEGERIAGKTIRVLELRTQDPEDLGCRALFLGRLDWRLLRDMTRRQVPVLTVSDQKGFARAGGMIELLTYRSRLAFIVNIQALRQAGLRMESPVLELAHQVLGP